MDGFWDCFIGDEDRLICGFEDGFLIDCVNVGEG